ncbi:MAG: hypothetical protein LBI56_01775 [Puniceicoccales bacterium]|nr:hypothetical protein [Puniceicoccales bacterium]
MVTTADDLFKYDSTKPSEETGETKEAHNYCIALRHGWKLLRCGRPIYTTQP